MSLLFLPDISFHNIRADSDLAKKIKKSFHSKILKKFPKYTFVANLECVLLKNKNKLRKLIKKPLHSSHIFSNFLRKLNINNVCLANNHTFDYGLKGFQETAKHLKNSNISFFGAGKNYLDASKPLCLQFGKKKIAIFALSYKPEAGKSLCGVMSLKQEKSIKFIKKFKKEKKCDYVIVYCHSGIELFNYPLFRDQKIYKKIIKSGADIVIGSHPHIKQGYEIYENKFIFYSIGDLIFNNLSKKNWVNYTTYPAHGNYFKESVENSALKKSYILKFNFVKKITIEILEVTRDKNFQYRIKKKSKKNILKESKKFKKELIKKENIMFRKIIETKIFK
jgi:2',3'-cyclic-nucleotide 2'-phosphodiesterase (5'-nucleotidase family)